MGWGLQSHFRVKPNPLLRLGWGFDNYIFVLPENQTCPESDVDDGARKPPDKLKLFENGMIGCRRVINSHIHNLAPKSQRTIKS